MLESDWDIRDIRDIVSAYQNFWVFQILYFVNIVNYLYSKRLRLPSKITNFQTYFTLFRQEIYKILVLEQSKMDMYSSSVFQLK